MSEVYLHKDDIQNILKFMEEFPDKDTILITVDNSSGIGSVIKAHLIGVCLNNSIVTVTKDIVDETSW
jgi:hypothetical protein